MRVSWRNYCLWVIFMASRLANSVQEIHCPVVCECISDIVAQCSSRNITSLDSWKEGSQGRSLAKIVHLGYNDLPMITRDFFGDAGRAVNILFMQYNIISEVHHGAFANLPKLSKLDLSHNRIRRLGVTGFPKKSEHQRDGAVISPYFYNRLSNSLEVLQLSYNSLKFIPNGAFREMYVLKVLSLDNNRIAWIGRRAFSGLEALQELYLRNNPLAILTSRKLRSIIGYLSPLYELNCPQKQCGRSGFIHDHGGVVDSLTTVLDMGNTKIFNIANIHFPTSLKFLYLNDNNIATLPIEAFRNLRRITNLHLNGNRISVIPSRIFCNLTSLKILDLSRNDLTTIHSDSFMGLRSLKSLRLFNNSDLSAIRNEMFDDLPSLRLLYLQNCAITTLPVGTWLFRVYALWLYGNPLHCTCQWVLFYNLRSWRLHLDPYRNRSMGDLDTWGHQQNEQSLCRLPNSNKITMVKKLSPIDAGCNDIDIADLFDLDGTMADTSSQYQNDEFLTTANTKTGYNTNIYTELGTDNYGNINSAIAEKTHNEEEFEFSGFYSEEDYNYLITNFENVSLEFLNTLSFYADDTNYINDHNYFSGDYAYFPEYENQLN